VSTARVAKHKWYLALALLVCVLCGGGLIMIVLALGYANPLRGAYLVLELQQPPVEVQTVGGMSFRQIRSLPPPPFTLEVSATMTDSAEWGIWLGALPLPQRRFLIDGEGYIGAGSPDSLEWHQFIHARPDTNLIYLHVNADDQATFRVNEEIAWTGSISETLPEWGLVNIDGANIQWNSIRVYADLSLLSFVRFFTK
jgi:hypothetical protein